MVEYCEVFERIEKKYRINADQRRFIEAALLDHMSPDAFGRTQVTSLYLDTDDYSLICRSLEKPLYKEKIRLRSYGTRDGAELLRSIGGLTDLSFAADADPQLQRAAHAKHALGANPAAPTFEKREGKAFEPAAFFEIKKKYKGVVYKRRVGMSVRAARAFLAGLGYTIACRSYPVGEESFDRETLCAQSLQIADEIEAMLARYENPSPSMAIACDRVAWKFNTASDTQLRVTFDDQLRYADLRPVDTSDSDFWRPIIGQDESIMEIKNAGPLPLWLSHALAQSRALPGSFSKYGTAYQLLLKERSFECGSCRRQGGRCA